MKKILFLSAVLLGAVTASQAGVRFSIGIPFPAPPVVVAPPAPVYVQPPVETYVEPPPVYAPAPPVVIAPPVFDFSFSDHRPYYRPYSYRPYYHRDYHRDWDDHRGHDYYHGDRNHSYHR
jgi:hypothetical protein